MANFCFSLGVVSAVCGLFALRTQLSVVGQQLKRIEVIEDDESEIIEAVRRMSDKYDFVVTR